MKRQLLALALTIAAVVLVIAFLSPKTKNATAASVYKQHGAPVKNIPLHISTWAYDGGYGADDVAASDVARLVSYAEGSKAVRDCHSSTPASCVAVMYFDPNILYESSHCGMNNALIRSLPEDAFVHYAGSGHRIGNSSVTFCGGPVRSYFTNGNSGALQAAIKSYLNNHDDYDAYFMDDTPSKIKNFASGSNGMCPEDASPYNFCGRTQEYKTDDDVVASRIALATSLTHVDGRPVKLVYNGANVAMLNGTPKNYIGVAIEGAIVSRGKVRPERYEITLNQMAEINKTRGFLALLSAGPADSDARLVHEAVILLGYSKGHTVSWENFEKGRDKLNVWPESFLYPSRPLQSMRTGAGDLAVARGVWRREFRACYYKSVLIGPCAALLSAAGSDVAIDRAWLSQSYGKAITLPDGDALSSEDIGFTAVPDTIARGQAVILAK